jgi:hypothetical protein
LMTLIFWFQRKIKSLKTALLFGVKQVDLFDTLHDIVR